MTLQTIDIKGKDYVLVNERLKYFRETYPSYSLISEIISDNEGVVTMKATISDDKGRILATGHAQEREGSTFINRTSHVENCETSAWGRALANFGIGIDTSVASAEEVANAIKNQDRIKKKANRPAFSDKETIKKENLEEMMFDCKDFPELWSLWVLLTKDQQADKEIKEWFGMRKEQLNG